MFRYTTGRPPHAGRRAESTRRCSQVISGALSLLQAQPISGQRRNRSEIWRELSGADAWRLWARGRAFAGAPRSRARWLVRLWCTPRTFPVCIVCVRIPCSYGDPARIHYYSAVVVVPAINVLDERQRVISRHRNWDGDQQSVCGARLRNKAAELANRARAMRISSS